MNQPTPWADWIGRTEAAGDVLALAPAQALASTLDHDPGMIAEGDELPLPWHWMYTQTPTPRSALGSDGHPQRGRFLPPVSLRRRMWAGSRMALHRPLRIGSRVRRTSSIEAIKARDGRSGPLVIVTVHHAWHSDGESAPALDEWQDLVYCDPPSMSDGPRAVDGAPSTADWSHTERPDPVLLMRYSALTFNGHRIHYDHPYATAVEGYPGLIVQGPLVATLLLDALRRHISGAAILAFEFKALRPLICGQPVTLCGRNDGGGRFALWSCNDQGALAMQAYAHVR
jgi:3-methylfumaryl-CoA hydratase